MSSSCPSRIVENLVSATVSVSCFLFFAAAPAAAHGVGSRSDLPLPLASVIWGSVCAVAISFLVVGFFWYKPRLRELVDRRLAIQPSSVLDDGTEAKSVYDQGSSGETAVKRNTDESAGAEKVYSRTLKKVTVVSARVIGLAAFFVTLFAALYGNINQSVNIAPIAFYILFWVGVPVLSVLAGDVWRIFNPMPTLAAGVEWGKTRVFKIKNRGTSKNDTHWWAAVVLLVFVWLELAYYDSDSPRAIGVFMLAYTLFMISGAAFRGKSWALNADGFGVLFKYFGAIGPLQHDSGNRLRLCWPLTRLAAISVLPGTEAVVLIVIGATAFDSLTGTSFWLDLVHGQRGWALTAYNTVGLLLTISITFFVYRTAIKVMSSITENSEQELADMFVPSLIPICVAYIVSHYFSLLLFDGQKLITHISDPFGRAWDLFGTAAYQPNNTFLSSSLIAWVQTASIVVGHILGIVIAHDRALERYRRELALRSQYPMVAAMIFFTTTGLLLLFSY